METISCVLLVAPEWSTIDEMNGNVTVRSRTITVNSDLHVSPSIFRYLSVIWITMPQPPSPLHSPIRGMRIEMACLGPAKIGKIVYRNYCLINKTELRIWNGNESIQRNCNRFDSFHFVSNEKWKSCARTLIAVENDFWKQFNVEIVQSVDVVVPCAFEHDDSRRCCRPTI